MTELLSKLNGGELFAIIAVIGVVIFAVVAVIATQWRFVRIAETEGALKQQMVERGMSAAEIDQVLKAGQHPAEAAQFASTGSDAGDKAALAKSMVEQGYGGEDIERVLKAYQPAAKLAEEKPLVKQA